MRLLKLISLLLLALTAGCGDPARVEQIIPTEYFVNDQWLACERVSPDPQCGPTLKCGVETFTCVKQINARGDK